MVRIAELLLAAGALAPLAAALAPAARPLPLPATLPQPLRKNPRSCAASRIASRRLSRCVSPRLALDWEIEWAPPMNVGAAESAAAEGATVVPLFPLGVTYLPYTKPVLNIFEPRYRAMYNDILFSGARRFMVCNVDGATGRLAEVGVLFYLDDLKEVSEQTGDRVKFVGSHSVSGRGRAPLLPLLLPPPLRLLLLLLLLVCRERCFACTALTLLSPPTGDQPRAPQEGAEPQDGGDARVVRHVTRTEQ